MNNEVLRQKLIEVCQDASTRIVIGSERRRLAAAGALFWQGATDEELTRFQGFLVNAVVPPDHDSLAEPDAEEGES